MRSEADPSLLMNMCSNSFLKERIFLDCVFWNFFKYMNGIVLHALPDKIINILKLSYMKTMSLLAHLSQGLTGEFKGYPWTGVRRPSSSVACRPSTISNVFSSAWPIKAKFYVEPPWQGGKKVYINGQGHMTKMAAMAIYSKTL